MARFMYALNFHILTMKALDKKSYWPINLAIILTSLLFIIINNFVSNLAPQSDGQIIFFMIVALVINWFLCRYE
jgi:hypothetical protein